MAKARVSHTHTFEYLSNLMENSIFFLCGEFAVFKLAVVHFVSLVRFSWSDSNLLDVMVSVRIRNIKKFYSSYTMVYKKNMISHICFARLSVRWCLMFEYPSIFHITLVTIVDVHTTIGVYAPFLLLWTNDFSFLRRQNGNGENNRKKKLVQFDWSAHGDCEKPSNWNIFLFAMTPFFLMENCVWSKQIISTHQFFISFAT